MNLIYDLFFGKNQRIQEEVGRKKWRDAIHDSKNVSQHEIAMTRRALKAWVQAKDIAEEAVRKVEEAKKIGEATEINKVNGGNHEE